MLHGLQEPHELNELHVLKTAFFRRYNTEFILESMC